MNQYSPDPDGPWIGLDWYTAADYCNWLSEQEGLPKDQWCYLPNEAGAYAEGMTIPADVLRAHRLSPAHRGGMGIRLPVGYGHQPLLRSLDRAAGQAMPGIRPTARNMPGRAGACCPNDLGLFDMLGNVFEWVSGQHRTFQARQGREYIDDI